MELGLINKKDFIRQMKIDRHTFHIWIEKGLPIIRIGYKTYLKKDEVEDWFNGFRTNEPPKKFKSILDLE